MASGEYLTFNYESVDDGSPTLVQYGSVWAAWLLGVAKQLTNPEIWHPDSDRVAAVSYADELITRLMGMSELTPQVMANLPMQLFALGLRAHVGANYTIERFADPYYYPTLMVSDTVDEEIDWAYFDVFLTPGNYRLLANFARWTLFGKVEVLCSTVTGLSGTPHDLYATGRDLLYWIQETFEVTEARVHRITFAKRFKNPSSALNWLIFCTLVIQEE